MKIKNKMRIVLIAALLIIMCFFMGCADSTDKADGTLSIVCTIYPAYDFIMNIVGDNSEGIEVTYLLSQGVDMHNFQPSAEDIITISQADLFVYVGGESDASVEDILASAAKGVNAVALMELATVKEEELLPGMSDGHEHDHEEEHHDEEEYDEHVWLSIKNSIEIVKKLCEEVSKLDSDNATIYEANATAYIKELTALDEEFAVAVDTAKRKVLLVADRFPFAYLADDYGLTCYAAFPGCSAETEASFETVIFLAEKINEYKLPVIFVIENSTGDVAGTVASSAKADDLKISTLDSMQSVSSAQIEEGYTYISAMKKNLKALKEALN